MIISTTFRKAVEKAYEGEIDLDELIIGQRDVLMRMVNYALRYRTHWMMSDAEDLFQETCAELIKRMWKWDETRGRNLADYCTYHIGVRLATVVKAEKAKKRHPNPNKSRKIDIWEPVDEGSNTVYENWIPGHENIEVSYAIREAIETANNELTELAKDLLVALANNSGNFAESVRDLSSQDHIRRRFGPDETHVRYVMRKKVLPEIVDYLHPTRIMP